jgi:hypothetical protein
MRRFFLIFPFSLGFCLFTLAVFSCQRHQETAAQVLPIATNGVLTNVYEDLSQTFIFSNVAAFGSAFSSTNVLTPPEVEKKIKNYFHQFTGFLDVEKAYWIYLGAKYYDQVLPESNHAWAIAGLVENGAVRVLGDQLVSELPKWAKTKRAETYAMLTGVCQFGIDSATEDVAEANLDALYWMNEKVSIEALLQTNVIDRYFVLGFEDLRRKAGQLPLASISKLYVYEQGGKTWELFKYERLTNLDSIRKHFPLKDRWIFTNYHWPAPGETKQ